MYSCNYKQNNIKNAHMVIRIIQITDLHLRAQKSYIAHGVNTYASAEKIIDNIRDTEKNIDYLIITGDLSDDETIQSYKNLSSLLVNFRCPIYLIAGNHDSFGLIKEISNNNIYHENLIKCNNWIIFMFNTKEKGSPNGIIHDHEFELFEQAIKDYPEKSFMIFSHHHPIKIGSESMDKMMIQNGEKLIKRLNINNNIKGFGWGHVHIEMYKKINETLLFSTPSTCYQAMPNSKEFSIDFSASPGYRVIELDKNGLIKTKVIRVNLS